MKAFVQRLTAALSQDQAAEADRLIEERAGRDPACHALGLAILHLHRGDAEGCRAQAEAAHGLSPEAPEPLRLLSAAHFALGQLEDAERHALAAIRRGAGKEGHLSLGSILLAQGRPQDAVSAFRQILWVEPGSVDALRSLALARYRMGDVDGAITCTARLFEAAPADDLAMRSLVDLLLQRGQQLGALLLIDLVRQASPQPEVAVALDVARLRIADAVRGDPRLGAHELARLDAAAAALAASAAGRPAAVRLAAAAALAESGRAAEAEGLLAGCPPDELTEEERARREQLCRGLRQGAAGPGDAQVP